MGFYAGIDLGTTFSAVAKINANGKPEIIKNEFGEDTTPSVLYFNQEDGTFLAGTEAKERMEDGDGDTFAFFKREMGNQNYVIYLNDKEYTAKDFSAILLRHLKQNAEKRVGDVIDGVVITVPAYFANRERMATMQAAKEAGLNVLDIVNEPTAAAIAYGLQNNETRQRILIYDLGGGTFDVTVADIDSEEIKIIGTAGDHTLGGRDWDEEIFNFFIRTFEQEHGVSLDEDLEAVAYFMSEAEKIKRKLTNMETCSVRLKHAGNVSQVKFSRSEFEESTEHLMDRTKEVVDDLLNDINLTWRDVDQTILVGGSTRMPMVGRYIEENIGKKPLRGVDPDLAVALGAAIRANITLEGKNRSNHLTLSSAKKKVTTPLLTIAGAKKIKDVTAHSLGMISISKDESRYENHTMIRKNSPIPAANKDKFELRTSARELGELDVYILQGDFPRPLDNDILNKWVISGIEHTPNANGKTEITVSYEYDANGIIHVNAEQSATGKKLSVHDEPIDADMSWTDEPPKVEETTLPSVSVLLALDLSGSMAGDPLYKSKQAMKDFVNSMNSDITKIGLMGFADEVIVDLRPTDDYDVVIRNIERIVLDFKKYGLDNKAEPFSVAKDTFVQDEADVHYLVVLTDGVWNYPEDAIQKARKCHAEGIEIVALGFGYADKIFLATIASKAEFAELTKLENLSSSFSRIAQAINN